MLGHENTHPPHCSPERYRLIVAGSWRINGVGNCLEEAAKVKVDDALSHVSAGFWEKKMWYKVHSGRSGSKPAVHR